MGGGAAPEALDPMILAGIEKIAREHLRFEGTIRGDEQLVEVLELDSLRKLTLVVEVENHFKICLDEGSEDEIVTTRDLVQLIGRKLGPDADHAD
ncbi:hypothetical protein ABI59_05275 [Acidobacteria bacterium Mor1]|nr:hypothetical protein ABI59_05275 [Acidobacteria bacterium Mor1]